jgi:hypothetical protein
MLQPSMRAVPACFPNRERQNLASGQTRIVKNRSAPKLSMPSQSWHILAVADAKRRRRSRRGKSADPAKAEGKLKDLRTVLLDRADLLAHHA